MKRTTPKTLEREIDKLDRAYWDGVDALCDRVRADHVVPFCRRKGWDFAAGMGSWAFYRPVSSYAHDRVVDHDELPKRLRAMLDAEVHGQNLGALIARDVRASEGYV